MSSLRPESAAALTAHRREAIRLAKSQEKTVYERCLRSNQDVPGYTFDELIGKGSFGRVYKGRQNSTRKVVAIKVIDIDETDFHAFGDQKDEQIRDFNREIQILRQAQESGAENLNQMIEALPVHSQLWLICQYCPGGSVKTLMRATNDRLSEKYLIVVARELGKALKGLHQAGIMHRDVKAANVLIHESGGIQLCDFGVAATIEGSKDKRRTFIGTLHWMPPELWDDKPEYSDEVDVWGYGCTLFECALGRPPNADLRERQQLKMRMRRLKQSISLPEKENFSSGLRSLVQFALNPDAASRPSMEDILKHDYLLETERTHPTISLTELVQHYYAWLFSGGQRVSLFMPGGAVAASVTNDDPNFNITEEWNFSMTQDFEKRVSAILEIPDLSEMSYLEDPEDEMTPKQITDIENRTPKEMTPSQKANFERRVQRGEGLTNIFDQAKPAYEYKTKTDFVPVQPERRASDLPFRAMAEERPSSIASNVIDLGDFDSDDYAIAAPKSTDQHVQTVYASTPVREHTEFQLADPATIRAKRADSKGPRDQNNRTAIQPLEMSGPSMPTGVAAQDFASEPDDPTVKESKPMLQEAAEITPTMTGSRAAGRKTMEWSFASAMSELGTPQDTEIVDDSPADIPFEEYESAFSERQLTARARKHATLEWSFSNAMAEINDNDEPMSQGDTPRRPPPLLRTMTEPVTQHEVQDAYEDNVPSRPDTALSHTGSEISQTSTDVDPFALERHNDAVEFFPDEMQGINTEKFYASRNRHLIDPSINGPGPEEDERTLRELQDFESINAPASTAYMDGRSLRQGPESFYNATNLQTPSRLGHFRTNTANASHSSQSSRGSLGLTLNPPPNASASLGILSQHHERNRSSTSSVGTRNNNLSNNFPNFPDPKPPSAAALSGNSSAEVMERELDRLLGDFKGALDIASLMLGEELRGRSRTKSGSHRVLGSGSEWEDETDDIEGLAK